MTTDSANGMRSGSRAITLLAGSLNGTILRALAGEPKRLEQLRSACASPPKSTLRTHLNELADAGAIAKGKRRRIPGVLEYELTGAGRELLLVATVVERWLQAAPRGPLHLGDSEAKAAIKALVEGYSSTMLRALASGPLSLTELDKVIRPLTYPALERRLVAMRRAGQVSARTAESGSTMPYEVTEWLRRGVPPLAAGARWERRHHPDVTTPAAAIDVEAALLLTLPLLRLPDGLSGACRMGVEIRHGRQNRLSGAIAAVDDGRIVSCTARLNGSADAWIVGSPPSWLNAVIDGGIGGLELGGDQRLARALLDGLHAL